ncbi:MAG TPA: helix-turn-helix domain-containing protein [Myxococcota bacterium]|nr:helix-turn-helix domain-containing protein [Myxococcota bacterium]
MSKLPARGLSATSPLPRRPVREPAPRRTQAERRAATARALLDATVSSLFELGHARTTTTEICQRAGVSQGALFKHYPTKQALLAAAAQHLFDTLLARYLDGFARVPLEADRVAEAARLLWRMFESPELAAAFELMIAARTDRELAHGLAPVVARHAEKLRGHARRLFPEAAGRPRFDLVLDAMLELMQGMALSRVVDADDAHRRRLLHFMISLARSAFEPAKEQSR